MVAAHLTALRSLLQQIRPEDDPSAKFECKHFFGGAAAYANGRIFMTPTNVGLAVKLPPASQADLLAKGAKTLRYFPNGPINKDYAAVTDRVMSAADAMSRLVSTTVLCSQ